MTLSRQSFDWAFDPPQQTLQPEFLENPPVPALRLVFISSVLSYSLAKTWISQPISPAPASVPLITMLMVNFFMNAFGVLFSLMAMHQIVRMVKTEPPSFKSWSTIGIVAFLPMHLALPLALLCEPLGVAGLLVYSVGELAIWLAVLARWMWGVQKLLVWPRWAAVLLTLSPFLLGGVVMILTVAFLAACGALIVLGLLT